MGAVSHRGVGGQCRLSPETPSAILSHLSSASDSLILLTRRPAVRPRRSATVPLPLLSPVQWREPGVLMWGGKKSRSMLSAWTHQPELCAAVAVSLTFPCRLEGVAEKNQNLKVHLSRSHCLVFRKTRRSGDLKHRRPRSPWPLPPEGLCCSPVRF